MIILREGGASYTTYNTLSLRAITNLLMGIGWNDTLVLLFTRIRYKNK